MKKLLALILALMLTVALAGCTSAEKKAYTLYTTASEKMAAAESVELNTKINFKITDGENSIDVDMAGNIKQVIHSETDVDMEMVMDMSSPEQDETLNMVSYYTDGYYYIEMMGAKIKTAMNLSDMLEKSSYQVAIPVQAIKKASVEKADGGDKISLTLDGAAMDEFFKKQLASLQMDNSRVDISYNDIVLDCFIDKEGYLKTLDMDFSCTVTADNESADLTGKMTMEIVKIGGVTVELPTDLDSYIEVDKSMMPL